MIHTGHAWAPTGTPGRCLEGVTPGLAGIFSALNYFVAETPTMFSRYFKNISYLPFNLTIFFLGKNGFFFRVFALLHKNQLENA